MFTLSPELENRAQYILHLLRPHLLRKRLLRISANPCQAGIQCMFSTVQTLAHQKVSPNELPLLRPLMVRRRPFHYCNPLAQLIMEGFSATLSTLDSAVERLPTNGPVIIVTASFEGTSCIRIQYSCVLSIVGRSTC